MKTIQFFCFAFLLSSLFANVSVFAQDANAVRDALSSHKIYLGNGRIAIGAPAPTVDLDIYSGDSNGDIVISSANNDAFLKLLTKRSDLNTHLHSRSVGNEGWAFAAYHKNRESFGGDLNILYKSESGWKAHMSFDHITGNVGIGTKNPRSGYKLAVAGKVLCEELKVQLIKEWPDYVFQADYQLPTLEEVEASINTNGHLPGIPSAASIEAEGGVEVGEMQRLMMQKIEELTLYMIDLKKEDVRLRAENKRLQAELEAMKGE